MLVNAAEFAVVKQLGPSISWRAPRRDRDWDLVLASLDLDGDTHDSGDVEFGEEVFGDSAEGWQGSPPNRVGLAYKRACGWDFVPGCAGVWLMMLAPVSAIGGKDGPWSYSDHLIGFVIVRDRDEDGAYESVGHIWTASAWHRRGIARRLLAEARSRFPITCVEEPYTDDGSALRNACPES